MAWRFVSLHQQKKITIGSTSIYTFIYNRLFQNNSPLNMIKVLHLKYFPSFARFPSSIFHNKLHITHDMVFKMKKIIKV